jgi:hypothetical protein
MATTTATTEGAAPQDPPTIEAGPITRLELDPEGVFDYALDRPGRADDDRAVVTLRYPTVRVHRRLRSILGGPRITDEAQADQVLDELLGLVVAHVSTWRGLRSPTRREIPHDPETAADDLLDALIDEAEVGELGGALVAACTLRAEQKKACGSPWLSPSAGCADRAAAVDASTRPPTPSPSCCGARPAAATGAPSAGGRAAT